MCECAACTKPGARLEGLSLLRHRAGQVEKQGASMEISVLSLAAVSTCSYTAGCTYQHCLAVWKYATVVCNAKKKLCSCNYDINSLSMGCAVTLGCLIKRGTNECFHQTTLQEPQDTHTSVLM